jgi:hypothetical protein
MSRATKFYLEGQQRHRAAQTIRKRGNMKKLTRHEIAVLKIIAGSGGNSIDAADFADEIVSLMQAGLVRLDGTFDEATVEVTSKGKSLLVGEGAKGKP